MRSFRDTMTWLPKRRKRFSATGFAESTMAELAWQRTRSAAARWGTAGAVVGVLLGLVAFAPASWLAARVAAATDGRLLITDTRGTVWSGSGMLVLTGGPDSRDASSLPDRLSWTLRPSGLGLKLTLMQACCINGELAIQLRPGLGRTRIAVDPSPAAKAAGNTVAQWPAAWLSGLGTPWNTLQLNGMLQIATPGFSIDSAQGRGHMAGQLDVMLMGVSSRLSTLDALGSYRLSVQGSADPATPTLLNMSTIEGALQINGMGQWSGGKVHFHGEANAAPGNEAALNNLLNIIGRRRGALSVISIG